MPPTAKSASKNGGSAAQKTAGAPAAGLVALVSELAKPPATAVPDASVAHALATGWHAREALTAAHQAPKGGGPRTHHGHAIAAVRQARRGVEHAFFEHPIAEDRPAGTDDPAPAGFANSTSPGNFLVRMSKLDPADRLSVICSQLKADLATMKPVLESAGQDPADVTAAIRGLETATHDRDAAARTVGSIFTEQLLATDYKLGKAFAVGWDMGSLAELSAAPDGLAKLRTHLLARNDHKVDGRPIRERLSELSSVLPPHAGQAVGASMTEWEKRVPSPSDAEALTREVRKEQLQIWRSVLTGEKAAEDVLTAEDLVSISAKTTAGLARAFWRGLRAAWASAMFLGIAVGLLVWAGLVLIADRGRASDVAGITALIGSAGLTWKGLGSTLGRGLAKLERPIWDAQVDAVIATVITEPLHRATRRSRRDKVLHPFGPR